MSEPLNPAASRRPGDAGASSATRRRLLAFAPQAARLAACVLACLPAWQGLATLWQDSFSYAHGWLIALVSVYLLAEVAPTLPSRERASPGFVAALVVAAGAYVAAGYAHVDVAQQVLLPVLPVLLIGCVHGAGGARRVALPLLYLWFAVPVWDAFIPLLQHLTVLANGAALALSGIPAAIDGDLVRVPAGLFEVAGGCSGVHFFIVALAVSVLYGYLRQDGWFAALRGVAIGVVLALVTNWLRVFVIIVRGNATQMHSSLIHDHYWFGWGLFAGALAIFFGIMHWLNPTPLPSAAAMPCAVPVAPRPARWLPGVLALAGVVGWGYGHALGWKHVPAPDLAPPLLDGPVFSGPLLSDMDYRPEFPAPAAERLATYQSRAGRVSYYQVAYTVQHSGQKLIGYGSSIAPPGWSVVEETTQDTPGGAQGRMPARVRAAQVLAGSGRQWRVWYWYSVGPHVTPDTREARLWQASQMLTTLAPARLSALAAPCVPDCDAALGILASFAAILGDNGNLMTHQSVAMPDNSSPAARSALAGAAP